MRLIRMALIHPVEIRLEKHQHRVTNAVTQSGAAKRAGRPMVCLALDQMARC